MSTRYCRVGGCGRNSTRNPENHFFHFPKRSTTDAADDKVAVYWRNFANWHYESKDARVCDCHFLDGDVIQTGSVFRLRPGAVPTLYPSKLFWDEEIDNPAWVETRISTLNTVNQQLCQQIQIFQTLLLEDTIWGEGYMLKWDRLRRIPAYAIEFLSHDTLVESTVRPARFTVAELADKLCLTYNADYRNSNYDRGHMAANANQNGAMTLVIEAARLCNMSPQRAWCNRVAIENIEEFGRDLARQKKTLFVLGITGTAFCANDEGVVVYEKIGKSQIHVPTHFYKCFVVVRTIGIQYHGFLIPNKGSHDKPFNTDEFELSIEQLTGIVNFQFFDKIAKSITRINGVRQAAFDVYHGFWRKVKASGLLPPYLF